MWDNQPNGADSNSSCASVKTLLTLTASNCILHCMSIEKDVTTCPAVEKMAAWLAGERTHLWLADLLGVSRPTVYRWTIGVHAPDPQYRRAIHDLTKGQIHFDDWYTGEELRLAYAFSRTRKRRMARRGMKETG